MTGQYPPYKIDIKIKHKRNHPAPKSWFLIEFSQKKGTRLLGKMSESRATAGNMKMSLENLVAPESKEVLKK